MTRAEALAWAAGLFEGEGSISPHKAQNVPHGKRWTYVRLAIGTTDEDVLLRFFEIAQCGSLCGPYQYIEGRKPHWQWSVTGVKADRLLDELLPFLGERRQARAAEVRSLVHV